MKKRIQIRGDGEVNITWDVVSFLKNIKDGESYHWKVLELETEGGSQGSGYEKFEEEVRQKEGGPEMTWAEVVKMADSIYQIVDLILLGTKDRNEIDYSIYLVDSSFWDMQADEENLKPFLELLGVIREDDEGGFPGIPKPHKHDWILDEETGCRRRDKAEPLDGNEADNVSE